MQGRQGGEEDGDEHKSRQSGLGCKWRSAYVHIQQTCMKVDRAGERWGGDNALCLIWPKSSTTRDASLALSRHLPTSPCSHPRRARVSLLCLPQVRSVAHRVYGLSSPSIYGPELPAHHQRRIERLGPVVRLLSDDVCPDATSCLDARAHAPISKHQILAPNSSGALHSCHPHPSLTLTLAPLFRS